MVTTPTERPARQHYNFTLAILAFAGVAFALQQTMVVPALPALQEELHASTGWITWLLSGFMLTAAVATPLLGKLGDQYGKERLLLVSLLVFFAGCVGATAAWDLPSLIGFRMVQGLGAAVFPLSFAIIRDEFPPEKVGFGIGVVSAVWGVGGGLGLSLSGLIVDQLSWRYLFAVGAAAIGTAALLVRRFVPESPIKTPARLDLRGAALLSGALLALMVALTEGSSWGWTSAPITALLGAAAFLLGLWAYAARRTREPLVDLQMLAARPVLIANLVTLIGVSGVFGAWVLIPRFVETAAESAGYGFGATSTQAGLYLLPGAIAGLVVGPFAGWFSVRRGSKWALAGGMMTCTSALGMLALWHERPWQVILGTLVLGGGFPAVFAAVGKLIVESVRPTETGVAGGINTVMRTVGGVIGAQVGAAILTSQTLAGTGLPSESAFTIAFAAAAIVSVIATLLALLVTPRRSRAQRLVLAGAAK